MDRRKIGAIAALLMLVVVLVGAGLAYKVFGHKAETGESQAASTNAPAESSSVADPHKNESQDEREALLLSDYDATVYTDANEPITLSGIAAGRPLVINFWATWCPYCVQEMPDYLDLYGEYGDRVSFAFVDVTDGRRETAEGARAWLQNNGYQTLPAYFDNDLDATASFGANSLPATVVFSAEGEVVAAITGPIDPAAMRQTLDALV